jgi:nitroreductase
VGLKFFNMIIKEILSRRSVREYKKEDVPEALVEEIIMAGKAAPTARNNQSVEFITIRDQETKDKIFEIAGQDFLKAAKVLIIPASDGAKSVLPDMDLAVASENMLLQAAALGLGSVWKNLHPDWAESIKKFLEIPDNFKIINIIPLGWPEKPSVPRTREELSEVKIHKEKWQ